MISERARKGFTEALAGHPFVSVDDLERDIAAGRACVFGHGTGYDLFLRFADEVCEAGPMAGDVAELLGDVPQVEAFARHCGAKEMHIQAGREGWARALAPHGYEVAAVILRKAL